MDKAYIKALPARPRVKDQLLKGTALTASLLAVALTVSSQKAFANPEGGVVVVGDATITPIDGGDTINVDQGSDRVVIDWTSFSIDEGETVNFNQISDQSLALNRVIGFETSYINGVLTADGYIFLINQNGIVFGRTAFVDVGGLVASTADITNEDFMAGNYAFNTASTNPNASIINEGMISVADTGLAALVAPSVRNSGIISANLGTVGIAGARTFTLDLYGDNLFSFDTGATVTSAPGDGGALVENTGVISATGGRIAITALAAEDIVNNVINLDGVVEANSVGMEGGVIVLSGGEEGTVNVSGTISATGDDAGEAGGTVHVLGDNVVIDTGAMVDASGHSGGGDVRIGGGLGGGEGLHAASTTTVEAGAQISADATHEGDGGTVALWSEELTSYEGAISARGGTISGDGGFVEVSSEDEVIFHSAVNVGASNGQAGELLIDPNNFTVTASVSAALEGTLDTGGTITIEADNDVFIESSIDGASSTVSGGGIDVSSGRSTSISSGVTISTNDGEINIIVNDDARNGANREAGTATFVNRGTIDSNGGAIDITNGSLSATADVDFELGSIATDGGQLTVDNTVGDVTIDTGTLNSGAALLAVTAAGDITVGDGAGTAIDASGGGDVILNAGADIADGGGTIWLVGGTLTMDAVGSIGSGDAIDTSGTFTLQGSASGSFYVSNSGGDLTLGDITSTNGFIDLYNAGNGVDAVGSLDANGYVYIAAGSLTISGGVTGASANFDTNAIDIQSTVSAADIDIDPTGGGVSASLNGTGTLDLTNAELAFLDATGTVSIGTDVNPTSIVIGAGTDISGEGYDLTLETSGTLSFDDSGSALTLGPGQDLSLVANDIMGGGAQRDVIWTTYSAGNRIDATATGIIDLQTRDLGTVYLEAGDDITLTNWSDGRLDIRATSSASDIDVETNDDLRIFRLDGHSITANVTGDIIIQNSSIDAGGDLWVDAGGSVTVGSGGNNVAINASGDVRIRGNYIESNGGQIVMDGGELRLLANLWIGSSSAYVRAAGAGEIYTVAASGGFGDLYLSHTGNTVITLARAGDFLDELNIINDGDVLLENFDVEQQGQGYLYVDGELIIGSTGSAGLTNDGYTVVTATGDILIGSGSTGTAVAGNNHGYYLRIESTGGDIVDNDGRILQPGHLILEADGSIGANGAPIELRLIDDLSMDAGNGAQGGDIYVNMAQSSEVDIGFLGINADSGTSASGDIVMTVTAAGLDFGGEVITADGDVTIDLGGNLRDSTANTDPMIDMAGGTLTILTDGNIGSGSDPIIGRGAGYISFSSGGTVDFAHDGDTTITTGSIIAGGDVDLDVDGNLTIGTTSGVAIDASGGVYDIDLSATDSILDGGGIIDMSGGGTLSLLAGVAIGAEGAGISTSGSYSLEAESFDGGVFIDHVSGTLTVVDVASHESGSGIGTIILATDGSDIDVGGSLTGASDVTLDAAAGNIALNGVLASSGTATLIADTIEINSTAWAEAWEVRPSTTGTSIGLGSVSGTFNLTQAEMDRLNILSLDPGSIYIGSADAGDIYVDSFTTGDEFGDITIEGASLAFEDTGAALTVRPGSSLTLSITGDIVGGGTSLDILFASGGDDADLTLDAGGSVAIHSSGDVVLEGTVSGSISYTSNSDITIGHFEAGEMDINSGGDIDIETGTIVASGNVSLFSVQTITIGNTAGVAIDASGGAYDVNMTAQLDIVSGGGIIDMSGGGALGMSAGGSIGAAGAAILTNELHELRAAAHNGDIYLTNTGATTASIVVAGAETAGTAISDIVIHTDNDLSVGLLISTDGNVDIASSDGGIGVAGVVNAGGNATISAGGEAIILGVAASVLASGTIDILAASGEITMLAASQVRGGGDVLLDAAGTISLSTLAVISGASDVALETDGGDIILPAQSVVAATGGTATLDSQGGDIIIGGGVGGLEETEIFAGSGHFDLQASGQAISTGTVHVQADTINLSGTITADDVILEPFTDGTTVGVGTGASGDFNLTNAELDNISASLVVIGNTAAGVVDVDSVDISLDGYDLTVSGGTVSIDDAGWGIYAAQSATVIITSSGNIVGGGTSLDVVFFSNEGSVGFAADGDVTLDTMANEVAGSATGSIDFENAGDLDVTAVGDIDGLTAVNGSVSVEVHSDLNVMSAINASTDVTLDAGAGNLSITAAVTAGNTATFISDTIHIGATVTADDAFLETESNGQTIGINNITGSYNLTAAELQNLSVSGTVTVGTTQSGTIAIGGLGTTDLSGEDFDLTLLGDDMLVDDDNVGILFATGTHLTLGLAGGLDGGGTISDFTWTGASGSGSIDFAFGALSSFRTENVVAIGGISGGSVDFQNTGSSTLTVSQFDVTGTVVIWHSDDLAIRTDGVDASSYVTVRADGDITLGHTAGVAIDSHDAGAGRIDVIAGGDIIDGGGALNIQNNGSGGWIQLDAGGSIGSALDPIETMGRASDYVVEAGTGSAYVDHSGGDIEGLSGDVAGDFMLTTDGSDIEVDSFLIGPGALTVGGTLTLGAGTGEFRIDNGSFIDGGPLVTVTADTIDLAGTITADDITLQPFSPGQTVGLSDGSGTFNLTNGEMDLLDTTGLVTVGRASGTGDIFIGGAGTFDLSDNDYDFLLRGGDMYLRDNDTALQIGGDQNLNLEVGAIIGGGTNTDIAYVGGGGTLGGTSNGVTLITSGLQTLSMVISGNFDLTNAGDLDIDDLRVTGGYIHIDNDGDVEVETGTLVAGGDVVLTVSQTLTIGDSTGVAIDASGGVYDIWLDVGMDIVDGGAIIDMSGGGTLTMDAGGSVGTFGNAIQTSGAMFIDGSADDGVFHVANIGGNTLTLGDITQNQIVFDGVLIIDNDNADIRVVGGVTSDGGITFDGGTGEFSVATGGAATASGGIGVIADTIDIGGTLSAGVVALAPSTSTQTIGLSNTTGGFNLTNAEIDFIDTDLLRIGFFSYQGDVFIGSAGTLDLSDNGFDVEISAGDLTFSDDHLAMLMGEGNYLALGDVGGDPLGTISGGGVMTDIAWAGSASANLEFSAAGDVVLITDADIFLNGESGDDIVYANTGELFIDHLVGASVDVTNDGDTTVETGTIIVSDTLTMDITGDLVIGDGFGTAIDASSGLAVILTASGGIINGSGTIDLGGSADLTLFAGANVGAFDDEIRLSGATDVTGAAAGGAFAISNTGGTTVTLQSIGAFTSGSSSGDVRVVNDGADIHAAGPVSADGDIQLIAGTGTVSNAGTVTAGGAIRLEGDDVEIGNTVSAGGSIDLRVYSTATSIGLNNATGTFNVTEAEFHYLDTDDVVFVGAISGTGAIDVAGLGTIDLTGEGYSLLVEGGDLTFDDDQTGIAMAAGEVFAAQVENVFGGGDNFDVTFPDAGGGNPDGAFLISASGTVTAYVSAGQIMGAAQGDITITNSGNVEIGAITLGGGTDTFTISGLVSGGSIDFDVESDLLVTEAVAAQGNIDIDVGDGAFTNTGDGTIDSAFGHVEIIADTVNIGASISATFSSINLIPFSAGRTVGLGSANGDFNLTDAEFAFLDAVGVQVGTSTAGTITIGDVETIDLTDEGYHLSLFTGDDIIFAANNVGVSMAENKTLEMRGASIRGGGAVTDIVFESATGQAIFDADGTVELRTEASHLGGTATGDVGIENYGDLVIARPGSGAGLESGGGVYITVHSDLLVAEAVTASGSVLFDAGTGDFSNTATVFAGGDVFVNADTVGIGATITGDNITLQPDTAGQTIGINDADGLFNLTEAELQFLAATGDVTIGQSGGTGDVYFGALGSTDLSDEDFDLVINGGSMWITAGFGTATLYLHEGSELILNSEGVIIGADGGPHIGFESATGSIGFASTGNVELITEASLIAGEAGGDIEIDNTGDLEVGSVRGFDGLTAGDDVVVTVHSDLNVTQAINASGDVTLDANTGNFANSGAGAVNAGDDVLVEATTIDIGATISGANIALRPNDDATTIGLSHGSGTFNLTNTELDYLSSGGTLTIGRETGTASMFVGDLGTVDLSDELFDLELQGGPLLFGSSDPSLLLAENSTLTLDVHSIIGGTGADVSFVNSNGGILFNVTDFASIYVDASEIAGTIGAGGMNFGNASDLTIGTVGGYSGLTINGGTGIIAGGTITVADTLTFNADGAIIAGNDFVLDGGDMDASSGGYTFFVESQGGAVRSQDGSFIFGDGGSIWFKANTGVDVQTEGVGTGTFTIGGVLTAGDFTVINNAAGNFEVGTVTPYGSGITINNAPGAGGDDIQLVNNAAGGSIDIVADINAADAVAISANDDVNLHTGAAINSNQGGFIAIRSQSASVSIDGDVNALGGGDVAVYGHTGIGGTGRFVMDNNGLALISEDGDITAEIDVAFNATATVAALANSTGDLNIQSSWQGDLEVGTVTISDVADTGVDVSVSGVRSESGRVFVENNVGDLRLQDGHAVSGGTDVFFSADDGDVTIGQSATLDAVGGQLWVEADLGTVTIGEGASLTASEQIDIRAFDDIDVGDDTVILAGTSLAVTSLNTLTVGEGVRFEAGEDSDLFGRLDVEIGSSATVHADGANTFRALVGTITVGTGANLTGGDSVNFDAGSDIRVEADAFVGSTGDVALDANGNIFTQAGSEIEGGETILLNAGVDVRTSGTVDASAAGAAVTVLAGGNIIDAGNTYVFTDGTLRAEAGGDIDLTLSGTGGATVTAALDAGGSIDLFLGDGGDLTIDEVTSGGGTTTGVTADTGYVDIALEDGLLTINEAITAPAAGTGTITLTADDMEVFSTVSAGGDIFIKPFTDGRGIALNDPTTATLNLTNAEVAFLTTPNTVEFGRTGAGSIFIGGSGSLDLTGINWSKVRFLTDGTLFMTNGVESEDLENLFDADMVLTGDTVIDTVNTGSGGDVTVTGTIEGQTAGSATLSITAGTGDVTFEDQVGQVTEIGALDISGNNIVVTDIATIGTQTYVAASEVTFGSSYFTNGYAFWLGGGLTLADDVLVDTTIPAGTGANITIDDVTNNGYTLTLNAGNNGAIELDSWTNTGIYDGQGVLNILDSDTTQINGTVSGDTLEVTDSSTMVSLLGDVSLNSLIFGPGPYAVVITGSNVFLVDHVDFQNTGGTTLGNSTSDVFIFGGGVDADASNVNVVGDFTFGGTGILASSLSLGGDVLFDTDGGDMNLGSVAGNGYTFTLDAGSNGTINLGSFNNAPGTGTLNVVDANILNITGDVTAETFDIDTLQTSGTVGGLVTADHLIVGAGDYVFSLLGGTVITNFVDFLNTGGVNIGDEDTDLSQFLGGAQSIASDTTTLAGTVQSQGGGFTFGDLIITANTIIDSTLNTPGGQDITFLGTINSGEPVGPGGGSIIISPTSLVTQAFDLDVIAGNNSTASFNGTVGGDAPLASLYVSALEIILHDVTTVGDQIYQAFDDRGRLGRIELNSTYVTMGGDVDMQGNVDVTEDLLIDTTNGGANPEGDIFLGGSGGTIDLLDGDGTVTLMAGGSATVRARINGALTNSNVVSIFARDNIDIQAGGRVGEDLFLHAGAFNGELNANPLGNITIDGVMTVGDFSDLTASGNITFLDEFNTYALRIRLDGHALSDKSSPVNITEDFDIGGLTEGLGSSDLWGTIRGSDTESASALGNQIELIRRDDFLFNDCIVEVGCLAFDPSAIVIPVFDPVIYLYERDGEVHELRYSDLPNTEIWFGLGGAPDIWEERLGRDDDEDDEGEE